MPYGWGCFGGSPQERKPAPKNGPRERTRKGKVKRGR